MNKKTSYVIAALVVLFLIGKCSSGGDAAPTPTVTVTEAAAVAPTPIDTPTADSLADARALALVSGTCLTVAEGWLKILKTLQKGEDYAFMDVGISQSNKLKTLAETLRETDAVELYEWVQSLRDAEANMVSVVIDSYEGNATTDDLRQAIQDATDIQETGYVKFCG